ncbi:MAG TPA: hypothetical protein VNF99_03200 [Stellaceae bacterium]|nr:hypothetical protein [Stellaceae bacterium]
MNPFVKLIAILLGLLAIAVCQVIFFNSSAAVAFGTLAVLFALGYFLTRLVVCPKCSTPVVNGRMGLKAVERSKARLCLKCGHNLMSKAN